MGVFMEPPSRRSQGPMRRGGGDRTDALTHLPDSALLLPLPTSSGPVLGPPPQSSALTSPQGCVRMAVRRRRRGNP